MKNFTDTVKLFFVFCGAVLGAGLLSGSELVGFFGSKSLLCLLIAGALFFTGFAFIGVSRDGFTEIAFIVAEAVFASAMLSGLDEITWRAGLINGVPLASCISVVVFHFFLSESIGKLEKVNCILIPFSVITVVLAAAFSAPVTAPKATLNASDALNAVLYACMNLFIALPSVTLAAKGKNKIAKIFAALIFAEFFVFIARLILSVSPQIPFPLFSATYGTPFYPVLIVALFIGSFTSLLCFLYPLKNLIAEKTSDKKRRNLYCFLLYAALFLLSRAGITTIIKYCYPLVGALGLFSIVKSFFGIKTRGKGDTMKKRSALCQERKRSKSKNSRKKNTAII